MGCEGLRRLGGATAASRHAPRQACCVRRAAFAVRAAALLGLLLPTFGCNGSPVEEEVELTIGCSNGRFVPLAEGDSIQLAINAVGDGVALFSAFRVRGIDPGDERAPIGDPRQPSFSWSIWIAGELSVELSFQEAVSPVEDEPGTYEITNLQLLAGFRGQFDGVGPQPIRIDVAVKDARGRAGAATWNGVTNYPY